MTTFEIDFQWPVYNKGYEVRPVEPSSENGFFKTERPERIVRRGGRTRTERPLRVHSAYLQFARLDRTPEACIQFANLYGFLYHDEQSVAEGEALKSWYHEITVLRNAVELHEKGKLFETWSAMQEMRFTSIDVVLHPDFSKEPCLHLEPPNLISGLHLQFAQAITSGAMVAVCQHCGMWFEIGGTHGRQRSAKTCSRKCHIALNNAKRGKKGTKR